MALSCSTAFSTSAGEAATSRTLKPIVTGASVVALKYDKGVLIACDTLGSYGSLARFCSADRMMKVGDFTLIGADGDLSDYQYLQKIVREVELEDKCLADGISRSPKEMWSYMTNVLYHYRSRMSPLLNSLVVAGFQDGKPFLGTTDKLGTAFEDDCIATGLGLHMALPILRRRWTPGMSEADAVALLEDCMRVLYYRDCRTINRIVFGKVTADGCEIGKPRQLSTKWSYDAFISPGFNP